MNLTKEILKNASHISFHTPSHCNTLKSDLLLCDTTELPYSDNLLCPKGIIKDFENELATVYNSVACFISTQGATSSVMTAIYAAKTYGAMLLVGNAHICVFNAMRLFNIKAYYIDAITCDTLIPCDVATVIITSPDYFGNCQDLEKICTYLKHQNKYVIIDASHGGHFVFSDKLPVSHSQYGDMVIHSVHKTLPVATGGSLLLVNNPDIIDKVIIARSMLHSSSPSYFVLCSLSDAFIKYQKYGKNYYNNIFTEVTNFKAMLHAPFGVVYSDDFSRLVIASPYYGENIYSLLTDFGIYAEMFYENKVVFIVNAINCKYLPKLLQVFNGFDCKNFSLFEKPLLTFPSYKQATLLTFSDYFEIIPIKDALHRKLFKEIGFYPPGVPVLFSGHLLEKGDVDLLIKYNKSLFGLDNNTVCVVK